MCIAHPECVSETPTLRLCTRVFSLVVHVQYIYMDSGLAKATVQLFGYLAISHIIRKPHLHEPFNCLLFLMTVVRMFAFQIIFSSDN